MRTDTGDDDLAIGRLIEHASSSWAGPSPHASQSRWAVAASRRRPRVRALKLAAAGAGFTVIGFGSVILAATAASPGGTAASVTHLVSHPVTGRPDGPSPGAISTSPTVAASPTASAAPRPRPTSTSARREDDGTPERRPAASPRPVTSPSPAPDD